MSLISKFPLTNEPKRKNRFLFRFPSQLGIQEYWLSSGSRPSLVQNVVTIPFLNTETYVLGRFNWETITIVFNDGTGPSASQAIMEWVRLGSESVTGRQGYAAGYMKPVELDILDPTGVTIEKWFLPESFLSNVQFGDLSMSDDELLQITATLVFPRAILIY